MDPFKDLPPQPIKKKLEIAEDVKRPNIKDPDIVSKIARVCGLHSDAVPDLLNPEIVAVLQNIYLGHKIDKLPVNVTKIPKLDPNTHEDRLPENALFKFYIGERNKFIVYKDGTIRIVHGSSTEVVDRAVGMGMGWEDHKKI